MLDQALIGLFIAFFTFLTWRKLDLGLFFIFLLLPSYLIRFKFAGLPSTLLEIMIWVVFITWVIKTYKPQHQSRARCGAQHLNIQTYKQFISYLLSPITTLISQIKKYPSLFLAITLFLSAATISIFTSIDTRAALGEWKAFYIEPVLLFIILISLPLSGGQGGSLVEKILFALVLCGLATSLLAIYQHFTGWMVPWKFWENGNTFRVTGWYGFPNGVGLFLAPIIPLALYLIKNKIFVIARSLKTTSQSQERQDYYAWFILTSCSLFLLSSPLAIFFAKSTGGLVGVVAGIGLLLIFWKKTRWPAIILGLASFVSILSLNSLSPIKQELLMQDRSGQIRLNMWAETTEFLSDNPIAGAGLASYKTLIYPYRIDKWIEVFHHPHNIFLTMWVNLGLLGLFGFTWVVVWFFRVGIMEAVRHKTKEISLTVFLLASMTVIITTGLVDSPYIKNDLAVLFWLLPALMITDSGQNQKNQLE